MSCNTGAGAQGSRRIGGPRTCEKIRRARPNLSLSLDFLARNLANQEFVDEPHALSWPWSRRDPLCRVPVRAWYGAPPPGRDGARPSAVARDGNAFFPTPRFESANRRDHALSWPCSRRDPLCRVRVRAWYGAPPPDATERVPPRWWSPSCAAGRSLDAPPSRSPRPPRTRRSASLRGGTRRQRVLPHTALRIRKSEGHALSWPCSRRDPLCRVRVRAWYGAPSPGRDGARPSGWWSPSCAAGRSLDAPPSRSPRPPRTRRSASLRGGTRRQRVLPHTALRIRKSEGHALSGPCSRRDPLCRVRVRAWYGAPPPGRDGARPSAVAAVARGGAFLPRATFASGPDDPPGRATERVSPPP
ncbi:MAG: hypothetical protein KatS3mg076_2005 [Candidatus Binatia bacterium]|nr:MAG: hypothetical protein KatS3mg076_2005 [Candidatus Binatia bacterium]